MFEPLGVLMVTPLPAGTAVPRLIVLATDSAPITSKVAGLAQRAPAQGQRRRPVLGTTAPAIDHAVLVGASGYGVPGRPLIALISLIPLFAFWPGWADRPDPPFRIRRAGGRGPVIV